VCTLQQKLVDRRIGGAVSTHIDRGYALVEVHGRIFSDASWWWSNILQGSRRVGTDMEVTLLFFDLVMEIEVEGVVDESTNCLGVEDVPRRLVLQPVRDVALSLSMYQPTSTQQSHRQRFRDVCNVGMSLGFWMHVLMNRILEDVVASLDYSTGEFVLNGQKRSLMFQKNCKTSKQSL